MPEFDAILVPGGGVREGGVLPPWVRSRLDRAVELLHQDAFIVTLSAGTPHRPPPLDDRGFPIPESSAGARHLMALGVPADRIVIEASSLDTIGNAYFARVIHCEPGRWRRLAIVTSAFHMPRTRRAFQWVFSLPPLDSAFQLTFFETANDGMEPEALEARLAKERESLQALCQLAESVRDLRSLHRWLFLNHAAYTARGGAVTAGGVLGDTY